MYKQPIIVFGIVIPMLIAALLLGVCSMVSGKYSASLANKTLHYSGYEKDRLGALSTEAQIKKQKADYERWKVELSQDTFSLVTTNLRSIGETLPPKEFQQTAFERTPPSANGLGKASAQKSIGLKFDFRGTYRTVQKVFLELESRMPNLQLQDLKVDPSGSAESPLLNFQVTYTAWEN